ncbi:MAG: VUT family protein [Bacteroidetes bacterium]|nr:MAG: VUT family protein [Bacteroidota bacterium]
MNVVKNKPTRLFIVLGGFFVTNALVAEFIGVKIFSFEETFGFRPFEWHLFGQTGSLTLTAGVLLWPIVFIMTDVINEYYGRRGVKLLSYLTAGLIAYAFLMVSLAIHLVPASWWPASYQSQGVEDMQVAFSAVFGQGLWIIVGSMMAFLIGQIVDAYTFYRIRRVWGESKVWFRATASTAVSQFIDSFVVIYIAFVLGPPKWSISLFLAVSLVNYFYKLFSAILLIPLLYAFHWLIAGFLGEKTAQRLKQQALEN